MMLVHSSAKNWPSFDALDGVAGSSDDRAISAFNLDPSLLTASRQEAVNIDGYEGTYKTLEFSANKRYSNRWGLNASYSYTWTNEAGNNYFNNRFGGAVSNFAFFGSSPSNPNEKTINDFTNWNGKLSGSVDAGWGVSIVVSVVIVLAAGLAIIGWPVASSPSTAQLTSTEVVATPPSR